MKSLLISLPDALATQHLGEMLGRDLPAGSTILLEGQLGAGKTTLIRGLARGLGLKEAIVSPTFNLINEYHEGRLPLYHFDLYRLSPAEVENIYPEIYWEAKEVASGITAIEWSQRLPYKPQDRLEICLVYARDLERKASISAIGNVSINLNSLSLEFKIPDPD
ncbi:MAG: tRNA (adenosine(37)-N6)-threonylcarbamoyltransferase complex ATPase subunit type 1 TsaE [Prochloraceae cyanobacterium]